MADFENALSGILSDPDAMMKIKALGEQLGLSENNTSQKENSAKPHTSNMSSPVDILTQVDPSMLSKITKFLPMLSNMKNDDETTALLCALRPFLSEQKKKRLDDAEKILRIMKVLPFIRQSGFFQTGGT